MPKLTYTETKQPWGASSIEVHANGLDVSYYEDEKQLIHVVLNDPKNADKPLFETIGATLKAALDSFIDTAPDV